MSEPIQVLVVDDDDDVREMLSLVLEAEGFRVRTAWNGREALTELARLPAGVMLLDLRMPIMTGWEVIDVLREEGRLRRIPIAICTSSPRDAPQGFPILPKPVDFDQMVGMIRDLASDGDATA
jgi:two-component system OmpR family response regulator